MLLDLKREIQTREKEENFYTEDGETLVKEACLEKW